MQDRLPCHRRPTLGDRGRSHVFTAYSPILCPRALESSSVLRKWMPPQTRASMISRSICEKLA